MSLTPYHPSQYAASPGCYSAPPPPSPIKNISPFERHEGNLASVRELCYSLGYGESYTLFSDGQVREANRQTISQGGMAAAILARNMQPHKKVAAEMSDLQLKLAVGVDDKIRDLEAQLIVAKQKKRLIEEDLKEFVTELDKITCDSTTLVANAMSNSSYHTEMATTAPPFTPIQEGTNDILRPNKRRRA